MGFFGFLFPRKKLDNLFLTGHGQGGTFVSEVPMENVTGRVVITYKPFGSDVEVQLANIPKGSLIRTKDEEIGGIGDFKEIITLGTDESGKDPLWVKLGVSRAELLRTLDENQQLSETNANLAAIRKRMAEKDVTSVITPFSELMKKTNEMRGVKEKDDSKR